MAGGTDLLVAAREKYVAITAIVDVKGIAGLDAIRAQEGASNGLCLGALTRIGDLARSSLARERLPHLVEAAGQLGSFQIRSRATLGGNLCNASPAAETVCPLLTAGAEVIMACGTKGESRRRIALAQFFTGPGRTVLAPGEVLLEVAVPSAECPGTRWGGAYIKLGPRRAMDIAVVNVAAYIGLGEGRVVDARLAAGSVAPTPVLLSEAAALLVGREPDENAINEAARRAQSLVRPISDVRASAWYRSEMVRELTAEAIRIALGRASRHD